MMMMTNVLRRVIRDQSYDKSCLYWWFCCCCCYWHHVFVWFPIGGRAFSGNAATTTRSHTLLQHYSMQSWHDHLPTIFGFQPNIFIANRVLRNHNNIRRSYFHAFRDHHYHYNNHSLSLTTTTTTRLFMSKPMRPGSTVDSYPTVSVNCATCGIRLFRYKKKNGTKSNLVKCYIERIVHDSAGILQQQQQQSESVTASTIASAGTFQSSVTTLDPQNIKGGKKNKKGQSNKDNVVTASNLPESSKPTSHVEEYYYCPECQTKFARLAIIKGLPALKLVGGKVRMTKK